MEKFQNWLDEVVYLCKPKSVHLCNGSPSEFNDLCSHLVEEKLFVPLKRPHSFWGHSKADDVARLEHATFICTSSKEEAGPTNNWQDPREMKKTLLSLFDSCMQGRTLYAIAFCLGPLHSPYSRLGIQLTDSPYVVCNMHLMTHMGNRVWELLKTHPFVPCLHSIGKPLKEGEKDHGWPCNEKKYIVHFPEEPSIWSFGSGYGGNALLSKKSFALRIASFLGKKEKWLAEHMLILGITSPEGEKKYFAASFPSACGKTNLAMLKSSLPGWKIECVGDDIAWMHLKEDGRLYAINPEAGFFGVAPGTSTTTNPVAMETIQKNTLFINTALTYDHDVWWEGKTENPPENLTDWQGHPWKSSSAAPASHPNARFTVSKTECPLLDPHAEDPQGVPISAILFGGRRSSTLPLVLQSFNWQHGVFLGASMSSERTAAAEGSLGTLRHDPFGMLPFCGYNMGDYFAHWLEMGKDSKHPDLLPKIFSVNWFRKDQKGEFLWPGFGENIYVLKWIFERTSDKVDAHKSPVGYLPQEGTFTPSELTQINREDYLKEAQNLKEYFALFGDRFPETLKNELEKLFQTLSTN